MILHGTAWGRQPYLMADHHLVILAA